LLIIGFSYGVTLIKVCVSIVSSLDGVAYRTIYCRISLVLLAN